MVNQFPLPPPPYNPVRYLAEGSFLTASQLVYYFKDFYASLQYLPNAPQHVFERLVSNLNHAFTEILEQERAQHHDRGPTTLQEMKRLKVLNAESKPEPVEPEIVALPAPIDKPAINNPAIGSFHTSEVRSSDNPRTVTSKEISFAKSYSAPLSISFGLTSLHSSKDDVARSKAVSKNVQTDSFQLSIETWYETKLFSAGYTWLEVEPDDPDFQCGVFDTLDDHAANKPQLKTTHQIKFSQPYLVPPQVVVWINKLSLDHKKDARLHTYATDVTTTGFKIHIESWGDTIQYQASASWVACTSKKEGVFIGSFGTSDLRSGEFSQPKKSGYIGFGNTGRFSTPPRVIMAVNRFDISSEHDFRISLKASDITATGMTWHLDGWDDTILYSAGASFIALA